MTVKCCVCQKEKIDGEWTNASAEKAAMVSHTYCPICLDASLNSIREEVAHANQLDTVQV